MNYILKKNYTGELDSLLIHLTSTLKKRKII